MAEEEKQEQQPSSYMLAEVIEEMQLTVEDLDDEANILNNAERPATGKRENERQDGVDEDQNELGFRMPRRHASG